MTFEVVGYRDVDFTGQDGKPVQGRSFYLLGDIDKNGAGKFVDKAFIPVSRIDDVSHISVGDSVRPEYNRYGKISNLLIV